MSIVKRSIILVLSIGLIFSLATEKVVGESQDITPPDPIAETAAPIKEEVSKRTINIKQFLMSDFSMQAVIYPYAVHYTDNGVWKDIDNRIVESSVDATLVENTANAFKVRFAKATSADKLVSITRGSLMLNWSLDSLGKSFIQVNSTSNKATDLTDTRQAQSWITYPEVYQDTDLQYMLDGDVLKENFILKSVNAPTTFVQHLTLQKGSLQINRGIISFLDEDGQVQLVMQPMMMSDAAGEVSNQVAFALSKTESGYDLIITADPEWIKDPSRKFPIVVDPSVGTSVDPSVMDDAHVSSRFSGYNYGNSYILKTGYGSSSYINRTFLRFALPSLTSADMVIQSVMRMTVLSSTTVDPTNIQVNVHEVTGSWSEGTITWNTQPTHNTIIEDFDLVSASETVQWDITRVTRKWYTTGNNNGVMIRNNNENANYKEYYSADTGTPYTSSRPVVIITYINNNGLESYWNYHSQSVGRAGTGYVNDYNGNLVFTRTVASTSGNLPSVTVNLIYNSNDVLVDRGYGIGWRSNYDQTIIESTIGGVAFAAWTDEDGTVHYFERVGTSNVFKEENNSGLTITKNATTYVLSDKAENTSTFTLVAGGSYLSSIANKRGQTILVTRDTSQKIVSIKDATDRVTTFGYANNHLSTVTDHYSKTTTLTYTNLTIGLTTYATLTGIEDFDGVDSVYSYHSASGYFASAQEATGYKITYGYTTEKPYRVNTITEKNGTVTRNTLSIEYGQNQTTYTDSYGSTLQEQFDFTGKLISMKDDQGNGQYFGYGDTLGNSDKLNTSSKLQSTIQNKLTNGSAELTTGWTYAEDAAADYGAMVSTQSFFGNKSFQITKTGATGSTRYHQTLALTKGKTYTFSGYAYANNINSVLMIQYRDSNNVIQTVISDAFPSETTPKWTRREMAFTLPSDAFSTSVTFLMAIRNGSGTTYFDGMQVEVGSVANRFNLIENGDFSNGLTGWTTSGFQSGDGASTTTEDRGPTLDANVVKINGVGTVNKFMRQMVNVKGNAGDNVVIGGWVKGNSVSNWFDSYRRMALEIRFSYTDGTYAYVKNNFNLSTPDWQFMTYRAIADKAFTAVEVYIEYRNNANSALFDGIFFHKEEFGISYTYDADGNVKSIKDLNQQTTTFDYDTANNLTKVTNADASDYDYTYNTYHDILTAVSSLGVTYSFTYDTKGNPTSSSVTSGGLTLRSQTVYTTNGNYVAQKKDALGNTVTYGLLADGRVEKVTDALGHEVHYVYDSSTQKLTSVYQTVEGVNVTNGYTYAGDRLKSIAHNGFYYLFDYDAFGNIKGVYIDNDQTIDTNSIDLSTNTYDAHGRLESSTYGNGDSLSYTYDEAQRITDIYVDTVKRFSYEYDGSGNLARVTNHQTNTWVRYFYDHSDRLVEVLQSNNNLTTFTYDDSNQTSVVSEVLNSTTFKSTYTYDSDKKLTELQDALNYKVGYGYDGFGRLSSKTFKTSLGTTLFTTSYTYTGYTELGTNYTSAQLASITNGSSTISYTYDANGNITAITQGSTVIAYVYDDLGQVVRENNARDNKTIIYDYDLAGNILSRTTYPYTTGSVDGLTPLSTLTYTYGKSVWKDQLTAFNGNAITYDDLGNPLSYNGMTFTWEKGRQLSGLSDTDLSASYTYNDAGIRTSKTVNNVTTTYQLNGDKVTAEITGNQIIYYTYDASGQVVTMSVNGVEYYVVRNGQNDVIALVDSTGAIVVEYTYSTYGEVLSITGSLASTIGVLNPYRYRGYRYDNESGLYYLQSRYYNPVWGRFINADVLLKSNGSTLGENMYAYCLNNPVNGTDSHGLMTLTFDEIHKQVQLDMINNQGRRMTSEVHVVYDVIDELWGTSYGFADVMDLATGEMWEIKPVGYPMTKAIYQLNMYVMNYKYSKRPGYPSKARVGGRITMRSFDYDNILGHYKITYWYANYGIVYYKYVFTPNADAAIVYLTYKAARRVGKMLGAGAGQGSGFSTSGAGNLVLRPAYCNQ
jgi:RHS repeat-associated protein